MNSEYVQYGCGWSSPEKWRNFDASPTLRFERIPLLGKLYTKNSLRFPENIEFGDVVKGLPVHDDSCKGVYCSHVLEHLSLEDFRRALKNTYKILGSGGRFRLVLPDLEYSIRKYIDNPSPDSAIIFLKETSLGKEKRNRGIVRFVSDWLGNSQHLWMWDYKSIYRELEKTGFRNIRRAVYGDSVDTMFNAVEDIGRWDNCLGVECEKL